MQVLRTSDAKEGVGGGEVSGFDGARLVCFFFEFGGDLDLWEGGHFSRLLVQFGQDHGVGKVLVAIFAL